METKGGLSLSVFHYGSSSSPTNEADRPSTNFLADYGLFASGSIHLPLFGPADRFNRKTLTLASALAWSLATMGTTVSHSYFQIVLCRILMGLACALMATRAFTLIRDRAPPKRAALASSFYSTDIAVASALASLFIWLDG